MANSIGSLVVSLGLDAAHFTSGLTKSEYEAKKWAANVERVASEAGTLLGGAAVAAATGLAYMVTSTIDSADKLSKMAQQVGVSTESLSALKYAAELSDVSLDDLGSSMGKFTKSISQAAQGTGEQADAFRLLGIEVKKADGSLRPIDDLLSDVAGKFAGYSDGVEKGALAQAIFGKSGAALIPLLNGGSEGLAKMRAEAERYGIVLSTSTGKAAEEFNDTITRLKTGIEAFGLRLAEAVLPILQAVADEMLNTSTKSGQASTAVSILRTALEALAVTGATVRDVFIGVGDSIGAYFAVANRLVHGDIAGAKAIGQAYRDAGAERAKALDAFNSRVLNPNLTGQRRGATDDPRSTLFGNKDRPSAPRLPGSGKSGGSGSADKAAATAEALLKKSLDGQVKDIREFADRQREAYAFAERYADGAYSDGLSNLNEFHETQRAIRAQALSDTVSALDKEIDALESYKRKAAKPEDKADADNKIAEAAAKRAAAVSKAGRDGILSAQDEAREVKALDRQYQDLYTAVLQLGGDSKGAAAAGIAQRVEQARALLNQSGRDTGLADQYGNLLTKTEELSNAQSDYNKLLERARNSEEAILLAAERSGATEMDTLRAVGAARSGALTQLGEMVQKANELAAALGTDDAIAFAEGLSAAFNRAAADVDPLLTKIKDISNEMGESIASSFENAILEGKGLRELLSGIEKDILRIVTRNLVTKPLGDFLSNAIGGTGGGGGFLSQVSSFVGNLFGGGKAGGGWTEPNTLYRVGENRPEVYSDGTSQFLLTGNRPGIVDPNPAMQSSGRQMNVTNVFHLSGPVDARTQQQIGAEAARALQRASQRNN